MKPDSPSDDSALLTEDIRRIRPALRRLAFGLCGDWHEADDLVQDVLIRTYPKWHRLREPALLTAYLRTAIVHRLADSRRRMRFKREVVVGAFDEHSLMAADVNSSLEERQALFLAMSGLGERQRAVVVLRYWEDLSVEETARILGCKPETVRSQASRALAALRKGLESPQAARLEEPSGETDGQSVGG
jgi:RNA polymerase sigma-70 factor (sigma-E family)